MEDKEVFGNILEHYKETENVLNAEPFGGGHINDTFLVKTNNGKKFILQRVNGKVFRTIPLVNNYEVLLSNVFDYQQKNNVKITPDILKTKEGGFHVVDENGYAWRLAEFIPGTTAYGISPSKEISYNAAKAMGKFQLFLNSLPFDKFDYTIINFHDPQRRLNSFKDSLEKADVKLLKMAKEEISFSLENSVIVDDYNSIVDLLPKRVTHNDTKLDNILFYGNNNTLVIDLDTVMPSTVLFDYGDMVRTFTSPAVEDEKDISKVFLRLDHFEALSKGYLDGLRNSLYPVEKKNLLLGTKAIIYEQILRFLTDFLLGNPYYKVKYPEHNLVRTRTQIKLLDEILKNNDKLEDIIIQS